MSTQEKAKELARDVEDSIIEHHRLIESEFVLGMLAALYCVGLGVTIFNGIRLARAFSACLVRHISTETA